MRTFIKRLDIRVSVAYGMVAALWIILSDSALAFIFAANPSALAAISAVKGLAFVLVTALALFAVLRMELRKRDRVERALQEDIAERSRTLEALRRSESRFSTVFHKSPLPTGISRLEDSRIVDVNDAFVELLGYEREALIGHTSQELGLWTTPEIRSAEAGAFANVGSIRDLELQGRKKSGEIISLLAFSEIIELGDEPHIVSMFYDITQQKQMEEQIRYQARLLTNVSDAVISTDTDYNIRSWNPAAEMIYGWKAEEVIGQPVASLLQGEYPHTTEAEALEQLQTRGIWRGETTHLRKDGSRVHVLASTSFVTDSRGARVGAVSVNRDISEHKQMEMALSESEQRFRDMADTAPAMLFVTDQDGLLTFLSRRWYDFTGQTEVTGLGWGWLDAVHPEDRQTTQHTFVAALETKLRFQHEYRLHEQTDESYRWVIATGVPRCSGEGAFLGYIGSVIDVTEHRQAQQALQEAEQRRIDIEKEKELLQLKEHFISVVSHEFRTPLSVIITSAELVHRHYDRMTRERHLKSLQDIVAQAEFMVGLLDDVLTFNRARAGRVEFNPAPLDLVAFCEATLERLQALDNGTHDFVFETEGDLADVVLDAKLLQHILVNLLSNAVKYSPEGGMVRLEVRRQDDDVVLRISDQGIGIPPESLSRLYDPFYRANNTGKIGGTGLGTAIVKDSVELHQGEINVNSEVGTGTTFSVWLPVTVATIT